jgi:hypothetical protein
LKLKHDEPLLTFGFKFNLRRYTEVVRMRMEMQQLKQA